MNSDKPTDAQMNEVRERLKGFFDGTSGEERSKKWDELWKMKDFLPWDRSAPSPALVDCLQDRKDVVGEAKDAKQGRRRRALVPGCGTGYDVLLLASHGFDAYGLDVSPHAVEVCNEYASKHWQEYADRMPGVDHGSYKFMSGDFFSDEWVKSNGLDNGVDLIYDYTFFCAIPPEMRPRWALQMSQLLRNDANSRLVCLEFPLAKHPNSGGPPHGLRAETYLGHLRHPGEDIPYDKAQGIPMRMSYEGEDTAANALTRIAYWKPERTHAVGHDSDHMSIWTHKDSAPS